MSYSLMVDAPLTTSAPALANAVSGLTDVDTLLVTRAAHFARDHYRAERLGTGELTIDHAYALADDLAKLRLDAATRAAGLLFAVPQTLPDYRATLAAMFNPDVAELVAGIARLHDLRLVTRGVAVQGRGPDRNAQAEVLRKMLLAMVADIRGVLVRLASRTQTLRFLATASAPDRRAIAQETLDIYAPLANRLGVWQLKWELEDLAFSYLEPETFHRIAAMLDEQRAERENFIARTIARLHIELQSAGINAEISGRPKHIFSIYSKMRVKDREFDELFDLRGVRILVEDVRDCYTVLGILHNLWQPIPKEFDDYISRPKSNNYRSLHTAVIAADDRALEVQIRTHEMHRLAELGVAAHWRYKEGTGQSSQYEQKIAWLRQVLAWRDEVIDSSEWVHQFKQAALDDTVYVLTPQGRVIDLPRGATAVDFAYSLHTDVGHRCRGARVDGAMVPLDAKLSNGQRVEIITAKQGGPSRDWLNAELGYIASNRARGKVRQYFNQIDEERTVATGRAFVARELQREGRSGENLDHLAGRLGYANADELFAAAARDEVGHRQIQLALRPAEAVPLVPDTIVARAAKSSSSGAGILVVGVDRLMTQLAKCCRPVPPDAIRGFVTRGRGVSIHRAECASFADLLKRQPERAISAEWGATHSGLYPVDIIVQANDRQGLLRDVSEIFTRERINVIAVNTNSRKGVATMSFTGEVSDVAQLRRALAAVREVNGVFAAARH